jgi:hypothetical protein
MTQPFRRIAVGAALIAAMALGPMAMITVVSPAVSRAECAPGQYWDASNNTCQWPPPAPPPPAPVPVTMCIGAPVPFVPMGWCFPVGGQ